MSRGPVSGAAEKVDPTPAEPRVSQLIDAFLKAVGSFSPCPIPRRHWYNSRMTLLEIAYELQSPLSHEQLQRLGEFANTYGLRRFRVDEKQNRA